MGAYSRNKGCRGERQFRDLCRQHGYDATRTAQHSGKCGGVADVVGLPGIHIECKFVEKLNLRDAMAQAIRDAEAAGKGELPIVAHKKNNAPWLVTMRADDWFLLYDQYFSYIAGSPEVLENEVLAEK